MIKARFFVEDRLTKLADSLENYIIENNIDAKDILNIEHSRFLNSTGDIITTIFFVYNTHGNDSDYKV